MTLYLLPVNYKNLESDIHKLVNLKTKSEINVFTKVPRLCIHFFSWNHLKTVSSNLDKYYKMSRKKKGTKSKTIMTTKYILLSHVVINKWNE